MWREKYHSSEKIIWVSLLGAVVFFSRWFLVGLQPDAALYAGLSLKVLKTGQYWLLSGSDNVFPQYFEHPPYFFQWGSWVLSKFGLSDGAARLIGAIPAYIGFLILIFWAWRKFGVWNGVLCGLMLLTFSHYTKFAATSMLEGPLSLGVILAFIGSFELFWSTNEKRSHEYIAMWVMFLGLMIATASKGVAGMGAWLGVFLSASFSIFFSDKSSHTVWGTITLLGFGLLASVAPLLGWAFALTRTGETERVTSYFVNQVFRSATTNRDELFHPQAGDIFYYLKIILKNGWPWWWTVFLGWLMVFVSPVLSRRVEFFSGVSHSLYRALSWNSLAFAASFIVPFTFVKYQLPHYIHPTYPVSMPLGAWALSLIIKTERLDRWFSRPLWRWMGLIVFAAAFVYFNKGESSQANRGQEFYATSKRVFEMDPKCEIIISTQTMAPYTAEAFALWYWGGKKWEKTDKVYTEGSAIPSYRAYFDSANKRFISEPRCRTKF